MEHLFCGLVALRTWLAARRLAWLVALRAWLGVCFLRLETLETLETPETLETLVLFRFGPKTGVFLVQKRNETPETLETPILRVNRASRGEKAYPLPLPEGMPTPSPSLKGRV